MTSDDVIPPQQQNCCPLYKPSWFRRLWWRIELWWILRKPRKVIREAIKDAKAKKPGCIDGPVQGYWQTGPPPALSELPPGDRPATEAELSGDPRHVYVKPDIGKPIDVDTSKPEVPHA